MTNEYSSDRIISAVTQEYLDELDFDNLPPTGDIVNDIVRLTADELFETNLHRDKDNRIPIPKHLTPSQIAQIASTLYIFKNISYVKNVHDTDYDELAVYNEYGENEGIYTVDNQQIYRIFHNFNNTLTAKDCETIKSMISIRSETVKRCDDKNLIPVNNGIFNFDTKILMPFSPDYVFTCKSSVDYIPNAINPIIHNNEDNTDWDVESWISELSDDPDIVNLLWEILGAVIRPNVNWGKAAFFWSSSGNNGKGTLCHLMRNLCGPNSHTSIPLASFSNDVMLEQLPKVSAVITDENDVGTYMEKAANFKAIVTQDIVKINRKYKSAIQFQFKGFIVLCVNEIPKIKDKSDSFYRRQLFVPFTKCFTGIERKYIKNDYLNRKEVLEYVLNKVLNMDYYELSEPQACKDALEEYKMANDPVRQFCDDILPELVWDLVPFNFLYTLYKSWYKMYVGNSAIQGRNKFIDDILYIIQKNDEWECTNKNYPMKTLNKMDKPEPLIVEYKLTEWTNPHYKGSDINQICVPETKSQYRGITRK